MRVYKDDISTFPSRVINTAVSHTRDGEKKLGGVCSSLLRLTSN